VKQDLNIDILTKIKVFVMVKGARGVIKTHGENRMGHFRGSDGFLNRLYVLKCW